MSGSIAPAAGNHSTHVAVAKPVVFFDGECGMCNSAVDFALPKVGDRVLFSPLQGESAVEMLTDSQRDLNSIAFRDPDGTVHRYSTGALRLCRYMKQPWPLLGRFGEAVPQPIRDFVYKLIAANRYRFFGKREQCRLPSAEEAKQFLP